MARTVADGKISKASAYREAAKVLGPDADLDQVHELILQKFGIDMKKTQISQYRTNEKKRGGSKTGKRRGRRTNAEIAAAAAANGIAPVAAKPLNVRGDSIIEFLATVKGYENKIGQDKICAIIDALYKR